MVRQLHYQDADFSAVLKGYTESSADHDPKVQKVAVDIIADIRAHGDKALLDYTNRFDQTNYAARDLRVTEAEIDAAYSATSNEIVAILETAAERICAYHEKQMPQNCSYKDDTDTTLGWKWTAVDAVGLYVPGGRATYPSSVLMNAIPAKVAGVKKMAMVVPTPGGELNPVVLAAAKVAGINEIYKVGGAQAVAALAYGTETIPAVDMIIGPGNAYVAAAKRLVFGKVGIDMIAGPSEILVIADGSVPADWVAADLLSQAEHDPDARSILVTTNQEYAADVIGAVEITLQGLGREEIARKSWEDNGLVVLIDTLEQAAGVSNTLAPEHLELAVAEPAALEPLIRHAGAVFSGAYTSEPIGDYIAGPSHVLPTSGSARFASGLDVFCFLKRMSLIECSQKSLMHYGHETVVFANEEGLTCHGLSVEKRLANLSNWRHEC